MSYYYYYYYFARAVCVLYRETSNCLEQRNAPVHHHTSIAVSVGTPCIHTYTQYTTHSNVSLSHHHHHHHQSCLLLLLHHLHLH